MWDVYCHLTTGTNPTVTGIWTRDTTSSVSRWKDTDMGTGSPYVVVTVPLYDRGGKIQCDTLRFCDFKGEGPDTLHHPHL